MDGDSPEPQPFDPVQPEAPALTDGVVGRFVLLVASDDADREWAERSAVALATTWARQGRRILLADLSLARPGLHRVLGVDNTEGVTDTFLFGSSIQRVARPVQERGFLFVPAGTATARPEAVTGSPRWASVVDGCARAQATLVAFLPSDLSGGDALRERATDVLLLTGASASVPPALQAGLETRLRAVLIPPGHAPVVELAPPFEPSAAADAPPFEPVSIVEPAADVGPVTMSLEEAEAALSAAEAGLAAGADADPLRFPTADGGLELGGAADLGFADSGPIELISEAENTADVVGGGDLDLELASLEAAPVEEPAQFGGELSFIEPLSEPASIPASAPEPEPLPEWARAAETSRSPMEDLRSAEVPSRDASEDDTRERAKPVMRPLVKPAPTEVPKKSRAGALAALLAVAVAGAVGSAWYGVVDIPWLSAMLPARASAEGSAAAASAAPPPEQLAAPINEFAYALTLDSFTDPTQPRLQAASLNDQRPDLLFVVSPVAVNGKAYYQLLAGPAVDSAGAEALRATLQTVLTRENSARWALRATPFAFNLGDRDDLASAAERIAELSRVDIPAYVLELPGRSGGRPRYRVYGGAYADEQEAEYFRQLLMSKGFPDARLVQRIGRHPQ